MSKLDKAPTAYTFDDFMLAPVHSDVPSRTTPDTSVSIHPALPKLGIPIISSPMNTVTEEKMLRTMIAAGGTGVLHRYMSVEDQVAIVSALEMSTTDLGYITGSRFFVAVGANGDSENRLERLWDAGARSFCVDVANGHSTHCIDAVKRIKAQYPSSVVMAGNVCVYDGALRLADAGTDIIRVGIGGGSMCTTRLVTGHGIPQLSAIEDCIRVKHAHPEVTIVADGGIRSSGDMIKALAIGADTVMLGSLLAGTSDTPGKIIREKIESGGERMYKYYHGMASVEGRESWFSREKTSRVPEGVSTKLPYKGDTKMIVEELITSLQTGMTFSGAYDLEDLLENARWRRVTPSGHYEGTPHGK